MSAFSAPRSLNEPPYCMFSALTYTWRPMRALNSGLVSIGVSTTCPLSLSAARCMSSLLSVALMPPSLRGWQDRSSRPRRAV